MGDPSLIELTKKERKKLRRKKKNSRVMHMLKDHKILHVY